MGNILGLNKTRCGELNPDNYHMENRIIVRVWKLGRNEDTNRKRVGHVSVEFPTELGTTVYVSFWPRDRTKESIFRPTVAKLMTGPELDAEEEGSEPDHARCFYTLSIASMQAEYGKFKRILDANLAIGWCLLGTAEKFGKHGENCASLAWRLLLAGGIQSLISNSETSSIASVEVEGTSSNASHEIGNSKFLESTEECLRGVEHTLSQLIESPNALIPKLESAKKEELERYPDTRQFIFESESPLPVDQTLLIGFNLMLTATALFIAMFVTFYYYHD